MRPHRLHRLTLLTRGVALLGLGAPAAACHKAATDGGNEPIHINAPFTPPPADAADPAAPSSSTAAAGAPDAGDAPAASAAASAPLLPRPPIRPNAPRGRGQGGGASQP